MLYTNPPPQKLCTIFFDHGYLWEEHLGNVFQAFTFYFSLLHVSFYRGKKQIFKKWESSVLISRVYNFLKYKDHVFFRAVLDSQQNWQEDTKISIHSLPQHINNLLLFQHPTPEK